MKTLHLTIGSVAIGCLAAGSIAFSVSSSTQRPTSGGASITGRVLDVEGKPVARAEVFADRNEAPMGRRNETLTDEQGGFSFEDLVLGTYTISAAKEEDGFPPTDSIFYAEGVVETPQLYVEGQKLYPDVTVYLRQRATKLEGTVSDVLSGRPIRNAQIKMCRVDLPDNCYTTGLSMESGNQFEVLTPPVAFSLTVSAAGYESKRIDSGPITFEPVQKKLKFSLTRMK